jgi:predicted metal-binding membrane protein
VAVAYFLVWATLGVVVLPLGIAVAVVALGSPELARAVPIAAGAVVLMAGALQVTTWKACQLARCRETQSVRTLTTDARTAFRNGLRIGLHCSQSCLGFVAMLLAFGIMDLRAMMLVTVAITAERLAPNGQRVARATGAVAMGAGLFLMARAALIA